MNVWHSTFSQHQEAFLSRHGLLFSKFCATAISVGFYQKMECHKAISRVVFAFSNLDIQCICSCALMVLSNNTKKSVSQKLR